MVTQGVPRLSCHVSRANAQLPWALSQNTELVVSTGPSRLSDR